MAANLKKAIRGALLVSIDAFMKNLAEQTPETVSPEEAVLCYHLIAAKALVKGLLDAK